MIKASIGIYTDLNIVYFQKKKTLYHFNVTHQINFKCRTQTSIILTLTDKYYRVSFFRGDFDSPYQAADTTNSEHFSNLWHWVDMLNKTKSLKLNNVWCYWPSCKKKKLWNDVFIYLFWLFVLYFCVFQFSGFCVQLNLINWLMAFALYLFNQIWLAITQIDETVWNFTEAVFKLVALPTLKTSSKPVDSIVQAFA